MSSTTPETKEGHCIGIGAQKAATSWLFKCLQDHPDICVAKEKEVHFFSDDALYGKGIGWYLDKFSECDNSSIKGEISTSYLASREAPQRIKKDLPGAKLVVILRDPVERSISHIKHLHSRGVEVDISMEELLQKHPEILRNSAYEECLGRYREFFGEEQLLVLFFDDICSKPEKVIQRVYEYLGVDTKWKPKGLYTAYNSSRVRAHPLHNKMNELYFFLNKRGYGRVVLGFFRLIGLRAQTVQKVIGAVSQDPNVAISEMDRVLLNKQLRQDVAFYLHERSQYTLK